MFGKFGAKGGHEHDTSMSQRAEALNEEKSWRRFDSSERHDFRESNWNRLSPLNKENQMHYQKVWNRSRADYAGDEGSETESETEPPQKRKRKRKKDVQATNNPSKRARAQSNCGDIFPYQYQGTRARGNEIQENEHSFQVNSSFQDSFQERNLDRHSNRRYGVMNVSSGHYSHAELQLPAAAQSRMKPKASSWLGPDIPGGEEWGSAESGGFGQTFPSGTPFGHHKSTQPQIHRNQSSRMSKEWANKLGHQINCLPETIDLTSPDSARCHEKLNPNPATSVASRVEWDPRSEHVDLNEWDSMIGGYKSSRMQSQIPTRNAERKFFDKSHSMRHAKNNIPDNGNKYSSQFTQQNHREDYGATSATPMNFSQKHYTAYQLDHDGHGIPSELGAPLGVRDENAYGGRFSETISQDLNHGISQQYEDVRSTYSAELENNSDSDSNQTIEGVFRKQRPKRSQTVVADVRNVPLRSTSLLSNGEMEDQNNALSSIRGVDTVIENENSKIGGSSMAKTAEHELAEQRRQKLASEIIEQRQKAAERFNDVLALFEDDTNDEARLARIRRAKEVERLKKQVEEDARIVEEGTVATLEMLGAARRMRAAEQEEERRAEKQRRIEEKRKIDNKKEEERLNAKRKVALEAVRLKRLADEEAQIVALNKLEADRVAAKKRAAALQAFKKADRVRDIVEDSEQAHDPRPAEESGNISDGGMFVFEDVSPPPPTQPKENTDLNAKNSEGHQTEIIQQAADLPAETDLAGAQDEENTQDDPDISLTESVIIAHNPGFETGLNSEAPELQHSMLDSARLFNIAEESTNTQQDIPQLIITAEGATESPPAQLNLQETVTVIGGVVKSPSEQSGLPKSVTVCDGYDQSADEAIAKVQKQPTIPAAEEIIAPTTAATTPKPRDSSTDLARLSISAIASGGRRRPPEFSRTKSAHARPSDPIRSLGAGRGEVQKGRDSESTSMLSRSRTHKKLPGRVVDKSTSQTEAKLQKALKDIENLNAQARAKEAEQKKEWDDCMSQLRAMLAPQNLKEINETVQNKISDTGKNGRVSSTKIHQKHPSLTSQITFVSAIKSQERDRKKAEEAKLIKFEKDKAVCRKRYDREIRSILSGQGVDQDEERISKQVDEKMAAWEEKRRKREQRESGDKDMAGSLSQSESVTQSDAEPESSSTHTLKAIEGPQDLENEKDNDRVRAMRAGVNYLASQNKITSEYSQAASKFRVEEVESEESEEDPDDEPDNSIIQPVPPAKSTTQETENMDGIEFEKTLNPAALDASVMPPLPEIPQSSKTNNAFLPDIVNPKEEDMIHSYSVRHRAGRGDDVFESVVLNSFHNREEANEYARHKLTEFSLGPSTGKSETHDQDDLYIGQVTTDKDKDHTETVWVTREIIYIGDIANVKCSDIKTIVPAKVFNVVQIMQPDEINDAPIGTIIATVTIRSLANKKAADHFLLMTKPTRPRMDSLTYYNDIVVPSVRDHLAEAEAQEKTVDFEGEVPDTGKVLNIYILENTVAGPLN